LVFKYRFGFIFLTNSELELKLIKYSNKWWFVDEYKDTCMKLKADNGNLMQHRNFWCGFFEQLISVEIVDNIISDLKFTTDNLI